MARANEPDTEFDPRHRIVGAIILVTLAVIVLPLVLDERPGATNHSQSSVSAEEHPDSPSKVIVKKLSAGGEPEAEKRPTVTRVTKVTQTEPETSQPKPTIKKQDSTKSTAQKTVAVAPAKKAAPVAAVKPVVTKPHWAVQVGTFSNPGNVRRLSKQLKERGYAVMFKDVNLKQGTAVRVRVGPYKTRASADRAQGKIKQQIGVKGVVVAGP